MIKYFLIVVFLTGAVFLVLNDSNNGPEAIREVCLTPMTAIKESLGEPILSRYSTGEDAIEWTYVNHRYLFVKTHKACRIYGGAM